MNWRGKFTLCIVYTINRDIVSTALISIEDAAEVLE